MQSEAGPKYETERTRRFRKGKLSAHDADTVSRVEESGCSVVSVQARGAGLGWSYTIGVYDTCGKPEIIAVGLGEETAQFALNEAVKRLREGVNLAVGRHDGIVGKVQCEFRPVDSKWTRHLMNWALWYYDDGNSSISGGLPGPEESLSGRGRL